MKNIKQKKCKNCMTEEKLIKTKLEIEAKEYEQKQGYKGLLDALYEEGQNKGYECARSYITPYIVRAYIEGAEPREKRIAELEAQNERIKIKYYELQDTLKKVRLALIKERTANIMNYGKGGVEMFDSMFEILKGVSN